RHLLRSTPFPYTTLFRSRADRRSSASPSRRTASGSASPDPGAAPLRPRQRAAEADGPSTRRHTFPTYTWPRRPWKLLDFFAECRSEEHTSELQSRENLVC